MNTAAFIHGARDLRIGDLPAPVEEDDTIVVDVESVGICGSDLHYYKDGGIGSAVIKSPFVPGHEFSARLQHDIESLNLKRGQLVAIDPALPCHSCKWCFKGYHNLCPDVMFLGAPPNNGALTQQIRVPLESIIALPDAMTRDQGAMLEPLGVCIHAIDLAKPALLESVAVLGCGPIGLGVIQLLKLSGCKDIHAVDPQKHRRELAVKLGATTAGDRPESVINGTKEQGAELVIEATNSPNGFRDAVVSTQIGGRAVLVGIPDGDVYSPISAAEARRRGLTLKFSRRMGNVYPRAIELVSKKLVDVDIMISHRFSLNDTADAFSMQADEADGFIKAIVYPAGCSTNSVTPMR